MYNNFGWTKLKDDQLALLESTLNHDSEVVDFGCGVGMELGRHLHHRVKNYVAIDKEHLPKFKNITTISKRFSDLTEVKGNVAIIAYPVNNPSINDIIKFLDGFDKIIYIGCNDGWSTACGTRKLFKYLTKKDIINYNTDPVRKTTIIVYSKLCADRKLLDEEIEGLKND